MPALSRNISSDQALEDSPARLSPQPDVSIVVPVYNEAKNVPAFLARAEPVFEKLGSYEIVFCVDPSSDGTETVIESAIDRNPRITMLRFSRRFGQPAATMAGIRHCAGFACVVIDVDLQDPPELIEEMHAKLREGYDVVYAKRRSRDGESWIKLAVSHLGYKLINALSEVAIPVDTGDFRIMSRRVVDELCRLKESHGFLRGLVAVVGFRQTFVEYDRSERAHGEGHYNRFVGSLKIGLNGLVGFSNFLLSLLLIVGLAIASISALIIAYILISKFFLRVPYGLGIPTIISLILFIGGIQLISVGILGQYIGRIYDEVKRRPMYIVDRYVTAKTRQRAEQ